MLAAGALLVGNLGNPLAVAGETNACAKQLMSWLPVGPARRVITKSRWGNASTLPTRRRERLVKNRRQRIWQMRSRRAGTDLPPGWRPAKS